MQPCEDDGSLHTDDIVSTSCSIDSEALSKHWEVKKGSKCQWCGIWMPLPCQRSIDISTASNIDEPLAQQLKAVDGAVDVLLEECLCQAPCEQKLLEKVRVFPPICSSHAAETRAQPNWTQRQIDAFLAAEALKRRWAKELHESGICKNTNTPNRMKRYCFKRTRASEVPEAQLSSESVQPLAPEAPQFAADESTGECKAQ